MKNSSFNQSNENNLQICDSFSVFNKRPTEKSEQKFKTYREVNFKKLIGWVDL